MPAQREELRQKRLNVERQLETAKAEVEKPFPKEAELKEKQERLSTLNSLLNLNEKDDSAIGADEPETEAAFDENQYSYDANDIVNQSVVAEDVVYGFRQKTQEKPTLTMRR